MRYNVLIVEYRQIVQNIIDGFVKLEYGMLR